MVKVAIIGTGNIGTDLLVKINRSKVLDCSYFIGRNINSAGIAFAKSLGIRTSDQSIKAIIDNPNECDIIFDCTSACDHEKHWPIISDLGKTVIDLTPAKIGKMCVPAVNMKSCILEKNLNMISCGGQTAIPIAYTLGRLYPDIEYIEVVSSIASKSAGPATRANLDEYVDTTSMAIKLFSGCSKSKAILILNPAVPHIDMQTTVSAIIRNPDLSLIIPAVNKMVERLQTYVPGYQLISEPLVNKDRVTIMLRVKGLGDYLPTYAGNLDIINCAAIAVAESLAKSKDNE